VALKHQPPHVERAKIQTPWDWLTSCSPTPRAAGGVRPAALEASSEGNVRSWAHLHHPQEQLCFMKEAYATQTELTRVSEASFSPGGRKPGRSGSARTAGYTSVRSMPHRLAHLLEATGRSRGDLGRGGDSSARGAGCTRRATPGARENQGKPERRPGTYHGILLDGDFPSSWRPEPGFAVLINTPDPL